MWSGIPWRTDMKIAGGIVMVKYLGKWKKLTDVNSQWGSYKNDQKGLLATILQYQRQLYPRTTIPTKWVFNDFGHISVKYFKDTNNDRLLNVGKEFIMGDFLHTTPFDEAATSLGKPFQLGESHGCIHLRPNDIDVMIGSGYLKKGNTVEVHPYTEKAIVPTLKRNSAKLTYEVHFYPALYKVIIYRSTMRK